jgi:hypothetical protein
MKAKIEAVASVFFVVVMILAGIAIVCAFIFGAEAISLFFVSIIPYVLWPCAIVSVVLALPLLIFRKTRYVGGILTYTFSYFLIFVCWMCAFARTFFIWGTTGLIIGNLILGVGIIPAGMLATLLHGYWAALFEIILIGAGGLILRIIASYSLSKSEEIVEEPAQKVIAPIIDRGTDQDLVFEFLLFLKNQGFTNINELEERAEKEKGMIIDGSLPTVDRINRIARAYGWTSARELIDAAKKA